jgi:cell cycle checkpoint protein
MDMEQESENENEVVNLFKAKVINVGILANILKAVSFTDKVNVLIKSTGLKFTVEEGKYVQASAFLPSGAFDEYAVNTPKDSNDEIQFRIPLKELIGFLKMFSHGHNEGRFGSTTTVHNDNTNQPQPQPILPPPSPSQATLCLRYEYVGAPFTLVLDEGPTITDFYLQTEELDDLMEVDIENEACHLMFRSEPLRELFGEIESNAPEHLHIKVVPRKKVKFSGKGVCGLMKVNLPESAKDVIVDFDCDILTRASYRFSVFRYSFKALNLCDKISLKIGGDGLLRMVFLVTAGTTESYVEFFCLSQIPDEDIED